MERRLVAHVEAAKARHGWPGCAAVLVARDGTEVVRTWGWADLATRRAVTPETGFRIGSTGKTLTALAIAALAEQGRLQLDDPVQQHLPGYAPMLPGVTIRHLLSHTSGVGELLQWGDLRRPRGGVGVKPGRSRPTLHDLYGEGVPAAVPPGLVWRYANHGIALLGAVVEGKVGCDFDSAMDELVLGPLGMRDTGFGASWLKDPRTAVGYSTRRGRTRPVQLLDIAVAPAGSAVSRAEDMARYLAALLAGGDGVVSPASFDGMLERLHQPDPSQTGTGAVWWLDHLDGHRVFRHGGAWSGFRSCCVIAPDDGVAIWLGVNAEAEEVEQVGLDLVRDLFGARSAGQELADLSRPASVLPPAGRYTPVGTALPTITTWTQHRRGIAIRHQDSQAHLSGGGAWQSGFPLSAIDGDDPTLFGAGLGQADPLSKGFTTIQVLGTPTQPLLLVNGRVPYVRSTSRRPWTRPDELLPESRAQLEALCVGPPG